MCPARARVGAPTTRAEGTRSAMNVSTKEATRPLGETPWGLLPPRLRVLYVTTARRTGAWLAEAFAGDSACQVSMQESRGASAALTQLRDQVFDAVLIGHEPPQLDAFELLDALHGRAPKNR